jgi:hypothetical protein
MATRSAPQLQIPESVEAAAFRAVEMIFKNDPVLGPLVRFFSAWRDEDNDIVDAEWNICPYLRISPTPIESDWVTEGQHSGGFQLRCEMAVQGTNVNNIMNYWAVIRRAIWPVDVPTQQAIALKIRGAHQDIEGVTKPRIQMSGFSVSPPDEMGRRMLTAAGVIFFPMLIRT